jgi:hypothetical protein
MTLRPEYSLGNSPYNRFLFASVGRVPPGVAGENGVEGEDVTVLSALTRLSVDPWAEAARLASLPPDVAATALAATLALLPAVTWKAGDAAGTARHLVALLPAGGLADVPQMPQARAASAEPPTGHSQHPHQRPSQRQGPRSWLGWAILFFVMLAVAFYLKPDNSLEPAQSYTGTVQR